MSTCEECKYFVPTGDLKALFGLCKRYPPTLLSKLLNKECWDEDSYGALYWASAQPMVDLDEWCGEWKKKHL